MLPLLLSVTLALSQDAAAHDALAARLVAVLPPAGSERNEPDSFAVERAATLTKAHPDKSAAVATAFADRVRCSDSKRDEGVGRVMFAVARSLSDDDIRGMIAFYTGPDVAVMEKLTEETPEWKAILARYPLMRFAEAMRSQAGPKMIEEVMAAEDACEAVLTATLAKEGISQ